MRKDRLLTPGPVAVPEEVLLEMARPMLHHRTAWYRDLHKELHALLQYLFQTKATCLTYTGSGSSAMEGAIVGCCPKGRGHKALVFNGGKFGERWAKVCKAFDIDHTEIKLEWGHGVKADMVSTALKNDNAIDTVIVVHSETSASSLSDVQQIAKVTRDHGALLLVDGITAVGAIPVKMDDWGVDACITGSQKAMMLPPGLGFAAINDRAWERINSGTGPIFYNDPKAYKKSLDKWDAPWTPAVSIVRGAVKAMQMIKEQTLERIWAETSRMAEATRAAAEALKMKVFAADPVDSVTGLWLPDGIDEGKLRSTMRDTYGFHIAGGQDDIKGKVIRISHMGYIDQFDILGVIAALELCLKDQGHKVELGAGVSAALKVFAK